MVMILFWTSVLLGCLRLGFIMDGKGIGGDGEDEGVAVVSVAPDLPAPTACPAGGNIIRVCITSGGVRLGDWYPCRFLNFMTAPGVWEDPPVSAQLGQLRGYLGLE